jgi:hypothetical protein
MYEAFDSFLSIETWHTTHPLDEKRFFRALAQIVEDPDFSADELGNYLREHVDVPPGTDDYRNEAIDRYVAAAWAVREYLNVR